MKASAAGISTALIAALSVLAALVLLLVLQPERRKPLRLVKASILQSKEGSCRELVRLEQSWACRVADWFPAGSVMKCQCSILSLQDDGSSAWKQALDGTNDFTTQVYPGRPGETIIKQGDKSANATGSVLSLDSAGRQIWRCDFPQKLARNVAVGPDLVCVLQRDGLLVALDSAGKAVWHYQLPARSSLCADCGPQGEMYISGSDGVLYCISATGRLGWKKNIGVHNWSGPLLAGDWIFVSDEQGSCIGVDLQGSTIWTGPWQPHWGHVGSAAAQDGRLYLCCSSGLLTAFGPVGHEWTRRCGFTHRPLLASGGRLYLVPDSSREASNPASGTKIQKQLSKLSYRFRRLSRSPGRQQRLLCLSSAGKVEWAADLGRVPVSNPALGPDGLVYVAVGSHELQAFKP
ncbi:PQQ-binding-like beta-propeller repeat protein [bacterium]|nr:PQQ-binding-like beta-propeller repeat protein [bacterium]